MIVSGFEVRLFELPYKEPIQWRSVYEASGQYAVLRICTDEGLFGLAEIADKPTWTGSTPRLTAQSLREIYEPLLKGIDPLAPERVWAALDRVPGWSSAKSLIDVALADLAARQGGLPLWKYLGGWTDEVPVSWLINRGDNDRRLAEAEEAVARHGFGSLKVKIGTDASGDVEFVERLRRVFGPGMQLMVDANGSYSRDDARRVASALRELDVLLFEDPFPMPPGAHTDEVLRNFAVPVMVDLDAVSVQQVERYVASGAPAIALKIGRTGYGPSRHIVHLCEARGALVGIGVYAESGLGSLAGLHFHGAHRYLQQVPAENCFFLKLQHDLLAEPLDVRGGKVKLPPGAGLGVDLDREIVDRFSEPA